MLWMTVDIESKLCVCIPNITLLQKKWTKRVNDIEAVSGSKQRRAVREREGLEGKGEGEQINIASSHSGSTAQHTAESREPATEEPAPQGQAGRAELRHLEDLYNNFPLHTLRHRPRPKSHHHQPAWPDHSTPLHSTEGCGRGRKSGSAC